MRAANFTEVLGLSRREQRCLRALFEAVQASQAPPNWLVAGANADALTRLRVHGLMSSELGLTMSGLVIAANLPRTARRSVSLAA
jgi:hypothetical protein